MRGQIDAGSHFVLDSELERASIRVIRFLRFFDGLDAQEIGDLLGEEHGPSGKRNALHVLLSRMVREGKLSRAPGWMGGIYSVTPKGRAQLDDIRNRYQRVVDRDVAYWQEREAA